MNQKFHLYLKNHLNLMFLTYHLCLMSLKYQMYPGFAKTAREEGFDEIADWFETLARAEKSHAGRFGEGLAAL